MKTYLTLAVFAIIIALSGTVSAEELLADTMLDCDNNPTDVSCNSEYFESDDSTHLFDDHEPTPTNHPINVPRQSLISEPGDDPDCHEDAEVETHPREMTEATVSYSPESISIQSEFGTTCLFPHYINLNKEKFQLTINTLGGEDYLTTISISKFTRDGMVSVVSQQFQTDASQPNIEESIRLDLEDARHPTIGSLGNWYHFRLIASIVGDSSNPDEFDFVFFNSNEDALPPEVLVNGQSSEEFYRNLSPERSLSNTVWLAKHDGETQGSAPDDEDDCRGISFFNAKDGVDNVHIVRGKKYSKAIYPTNSMYNYYSAFEHTAKMSVHSTDYCSVEASFDLTYYRTVYTAIYDHSSDEFESNTVNIGTVDTYVSYSYPRQTCTKPSGSAEPYLHNCQWATIESEFRLSGGKYSESNLHGRPPVELLSLDDSQGAPLYKITIFDTAIMCHPGTTADCDESRVPTEYIEMKDEFMQFYVVVL